MNILGCVRAVDGNYVFLTNAHHFFVGQDVRVFRDCETEVSMSEVREVKIEQKRLRLWPKVDVQAGDLLLTEGN